LEKKNATEGTAAVLHGYLYNTNLLFATSQANDQFAVWPAGGKFVNLRRDDAMTRKKKLEGLSYEEFRRQVKEGHIEPLYLFIGEEEYLHEHALRLLYNCIEEASHAFNIAVFSIGAEGASGHRATLAEAIDNANQWPMMSGRRVVVIRDFDKIKEDETEIVLEYLKHPATTATVVFQSSTLDQRRKISAALLKACAVVSFDRPTEQQAQLWAEQYLKRRNCRIEPNALGHLIGLAGTRMRRLANELDKLAAYAGSSIINLSIVDELVPRSREHTAFELWDAILERDRKRALRIMERLLDDGEEPVMIVGALGGLYRRMLAGKELMSRQAPIEEVMKATGQYGYRAKAFNARINRTSRQELTSGIRRLAEVDNSIKNSEATPRLQLEFLICELTLPETARQGYIPGDVRRKT
jgi:DNA polymerase-3 subunit delta